MAEERKPAHHGLNIPGPVSVSETEYDAVVHKWTAAREWAEQKKVELLAGIGTPALPPLSGDEMMTISPNEYAASYTRRLNWYNQVNKRLASVKVALKVCENTLTDLGRKIRTTNRKLGSKKSVEELKDHVGTQPHHEQIELEVVKYECLKILLDQEFDEAEQNLKAVSRQVEIRKEEFGGERRNANIPQAVQPAVPPGTRRYTR